MEEVLDAVIVGERAGRLGLLASDCGLSRLSDLPRVAWSGVSKTSLAMVSTTMGGKRLLSLGGGGGGRFDRLLDEGVGESGRRIVRGSVDPGRGVREFSCIVFW